VLVALVAEELVPLAVGQVRLDQRQDLVFLVIQMVTSDPRQLLGGGRRAGGAQRVLDRLQQLLDRAVLARHRVHTRLIVGVGETRPQPRPQVLVLRAMVRVQFRAQQLPPRPDVRTVRVAPARLVQAIEIAPERRVHRVHEADVGRPSVGLGALLRFTLPGQRAQPDGGSQTSHHETGQSLPHRRTPCARSVDPPSRSPPPAAGRARPRPSADTPIATVDAVISRTPARGPRHERERGRRGVQYSFLMTK
jgi:hypothetical protein